MSNRENNNEVDSIVVVFALLGAAAVIIAIAFYVLLCFAAFVLTVLCLCAWDRPIRLCGAVLTPEEARAFVYRGCCGAFIVPAFALLCAFALGAKLSVEALPHLAAFGYAGGAVLLPLLIEEGQAEGEPAAPALPVARLSPPEAPPPAPVPTPAPFRYASWDDEEEGRA